MRGQRVSTTAATTTTHIATTKGPVQSNAAGGTRSGSRGRSTTADPKRGDTWTGENLVNRMAAKMMSTSSADSHLGGRRPTRVWPAGVPTRPIVPSEHQAARPAQAEAKTAFIAITEYGNPSSGGHVRSTKALSGRRALLPI